MDLELKRWEKKLAQNVNVILRVTSNMLICFWKRFPHINCYAFDI